jgi:hypothetical protein
MGSPHGFVDDSALEGGGFELSTFFVKGEVLDR